MIGFLKGKILMKQAPSLMIDVAGIGYEVDAPMSTFYVLPEIDQDVQLYIHFVVREDAQQLYGFSTERERALFRYLLKVNGVGPKLALTILSGIEPDVFVSCVMEQDSLRLTKIPGVGKKTAERMVIELRDRLKNWLEEPSDPSVKTKEGFVENNVQHEAESALIALGYKPQQASRIIAKVYSKDLNCEEVIRLALKTALETA